MLPMTRTGVSHILSHPSGYASRETEPLRRDLMQGEWWLGLKEQPISGHKPGTESFQPGMSVGFLEEVRFGLSLKRF